MILIYNLALLLLFLLLLPFYYVHLKKRGKGLSYLKQALGFDVPEFPPRDLSTGGRILVHCVSMGETLAAKPLVLYLRNYFPGVEIVISNTTVTGQETARKQLNKLVNAVLFAPLDFSFSVRSFLKGVKPDMIIIFETELWPGMLFHARKMNIPVFLVNARISDSTSKIYHHFSFFWRPLLPALKLVCVQSSEELHKFERLPFSEGQLTVAGNMKFDQQGPEMTQEDQRDLRRSFSCSPDDFTVVIGSTHPQEERILLSALKPLLDQYSRLRLILAPRHLERVPEIIQLLSEMGISFARRSDYIHEPLPRVPLILLDTLGELVKVYSLSRVSILGGSFVNIGGHNVLEPAQMGSFPVFGPYMHKQKPMLDLSKKTGGGLQIASAGELSPCLEKWILQPALLDPLCEKARSMVSLNQGATRTVFMHILRNSYLGGNNVE